ncbi:LLM class F420-dependent oxidoreductase [Frankia sp. CNm7]|uniref:LLM class F420-dependent oxidoreductase n=1 Tax=Frankia nepalensis TaxID=1836974 RepID=A0A937URK4_9ACTN|nr:LLM class F420-dependent oxidoreductase [Frankia nepalensis]MBL7494943.1 LLM class F420-dependent oxidoreductase [Frankia nepalensis]MBL7515994.1 LLM class F420-dependent oxidoreductase [Frankia nepalensis]MBL7519775.1 LLM class F420-dependent oxidoreductase [Frankia nepalensis]MBL7632954.1 LLM class F420-dependent oxidoreductase [Frankia nepalensis]
MRFILHYPETNGTERDMLEAGPIDEVAAAAERAGFDAIALTEHPVPGAKWLETGGHQSLDPFVALGFAAAATTRLRLMTNLVVAPYRNPFLLAKAAATVDKLSGGRLILGMGTGYQKSEFFALGVDLAERAALFDEALDVLPLHWAGEPFSYQGLHFDARNVVARPKPVQDPIPIWVGGNSGRARRRAAQKAQGWLPMMAPPEVAVTAQTMAITSREQLATLIQGVKDEAAAAGRPGPLDFTSSYNDAALASAPTADADRHREQWAELEKIGVNWLIISCHSTSREQTFDFIETFGGTYLS